MKIKTIIKKTKMITDTRAVHGLVSAANWVQIWNLPKHLSEWESTNYPFPRHSFTLSEKLSVIWINQKE